MGQAAREINFKRLNTANGLSNNQISCFYEDQSGFLWIGTLSGLNRYDGYQFIHYYHEESNENSLANNTILWIAEGPNNNLWIKTGYGISIYNPITEKFSSDQVWLSKLNAQSVDINRVLVDYIGHTWISVAGQGIRKVEGNSIKMITADAESAIRLSSNNLVDMSLDSRGDIWTLYEGGKLDVIDTRINRVIRKFDLSSHLKDLPGLNIFVDRDQGVWVYSRGDELGLLHLNTQVGEIRLWDETQLYSRIIRQVLQDHNGDIWVGTDHGGISILNKNSWNIRNYRHEPNVIGTLGHNSVNALFKASNGIIWVGQTKNGMSFYNGQAPKFMHYQFPSDDPSFNDMSSIVEDSKGNLLIGTNGQGLLKFDTTARTFEQSPIFDSQHSSIGAKVIVCLFQSSEGCLWVGTYTQGLLKICGDQVSHFLPSDEKNSISDNNVWSVFEDSNQEVWIGTLLNGLDRYDSKSNTFLNYNQSNELTVNYVTDIEEDNQKQIWIATGQGLTVYDMKSDTFHQYIANDSIPSSLSNNSVISLYLDSHKRMWICTMQGLNLYNPETDNFSHFKESDGLSSDLTTAVLEADDGTFWVSTSKGLSKLTFSSDGKVDVQIFDRSDGLQGDVFNNGAALKTRGGKLVFAGENGFNMFDPESIAINENPPDIVFTNFYLNSTLVHPEEKVGGRILLPENINLMNKIELAYNQNSFAIEFAALTFDQSNKNKYQYMLEGFDEDWVSISPEIRVANYTNLDYGDYTFRVKASNNHNTWNDEGRIIQLIIHPPFWKTSWAYFIYIVLAVFGLYFTRHLIISREREKARIDSERLNARRVHELDLMKLKFFTNISHDFRTPISLVLSPIERLIKDPTSARKSDFVMIQRNARRLLTLVNQLLDFRKMEANKHRIEPSAGDLVKFIYDVVESFSDLSQEKKIDLSVESDLKQFLTKFDKDKMDKIMFNLLSNAFKFTLPGGRIVVQLDQDQKDQIIISVIDTGIGIPSEMQDLIFNRFMQSDTHEGVMNNGTGIGLSITKEFVELHGGNISVESDVDEGSVFTMEFPFSQLVKLETPLETQERVATISTNEDIDSDKSKPYVYLVEDNADFRFYLHDNLTRFYNVSEASNGKDAWKAICRTHPDIVISDIMMPTMNGLELCEKIKADPRTADIPVILLTAQSSNQHKLEGLEAGALEFISKPFNFEILVSTINSALKFQKNVNDASKKIPIQTTEIEIVSRDEQLVKNAIKLVEDNIDNSEFSVEYMSHELGYSRGHLYQKMLQITGKTPMDFIRDIRMSRAAEYLQKSQLTVAEVAYKVGYNNPKLFSRYFKSRHKVYPSQYAQKKSNES